MEEQSQNSFLDQLQNKLKGGLKPTTTKTTFPDGSVQWASAQGSSCESKELGKTFGFVVDEKPDLTVGQVTPWLFVSSQDVPCDKTILSTFGVTHVLSLLPGFVLPRDSANFISEHLVLDFYDEESFSLEGELMSRAFKFIGDGKGSGGKVLVHCNAGISRAPSVIIAYLMKCERLSLDEAWDKVKLVRPEIRPNAGFVRQLREINKLLLVAD